MKQIPPMKNHFAWKARPVKAGLVDRIKGKRYKGTMLSIKARGQVFDVFIKDIFVVKHTFEQEIQEARLMRARGDTFYFMVNLGTHGVSQKLIDIGGYSFTFLKTEYDRLGDRSLSKETIVYSKDEIKDIHADSISFAHKLHRVRNRLFYGVSDKEGDGGFDNSD